MNCVCACEWDARETKMPKFWVFVEIYNSKMLTFVEDCFCFCVQHGVLGVLLLLGTLFALTFFLVGNIHAMRTYDGDVVDRAAE